MVLIEPQEMPDRVSWVLTQLQNCHLSHRVPREEDSQIIEFVAVIQ